jgi:hypothetical protein
MWYALLCGLYYFWLSHFKVSILLSQDMGGKKEYRGMEGFRGGGVGGMGMEGGVVWEAGREF